MASYSVVNNEMRVVMEIDYECFSEFQPACNFIIRPVPSKNQPSRAMAQVYVPTYLIIQLVQNFINPQSSNVTVNWGNNQTSIGRQDNVFYINGTNGTAQIPLQDSQWNDTIEYLKLIYQFGPIAKIAGKTARLHTINLLRQLGLDVQIKDSYGNDRYLTTQYWDKDAGKNGTYNIIDVIADKVANKILSKLNTNNNSSSNNFSRGHVDSATSTMPGINPIGNPNPAPMGIPQGMAMPPLPPNPVIQQRENSQIPLGGNTPPNPIKNIPMPPLPEAGVNNGSMVRGIQDILSDTFNN